MKSGDRLVIKKGTSVHSTYIPWPAGGKLTGRTYIVRVHDAHLEELVDDGEVWYVSWAGAGGYWKWAYLHNPTPLNDLSELARVKQEKKQSATAQRRSE